MVKPPKQPIVRKRKRFESVVSRSEKKPANIPMRRQPIRLTTTVPIGKAAALYLFRHSVARNLSKVPIKPPPAINNDVYISSFILLIN